MQFIIVFVVFLKLVKPGETIENIIINQNPELEGMNVTQTQVRTLLETFGNRCLLILDGLDEHALGKNKDVLKIIRGQKLPYCNVIISSRPHSTKEIEKYFQTVVRVNGFTRLEAEKFAFKILEDDRKVQDILDFRPSDFQKGVNLFNFLILLSFMCLLVREEDIDLSNKSLSSGEIYMKMVLCLYKKFTIRMCIDYQENEFIEALKRIGELALKTLLSGEPQMQRHEVFEKVGNDAFNYGLLIGDEDSFLFSKNVTADILVTFPHRSIQEFLGAFFFMLMLCTGESVETLLGVHYSKLIFMENSLFLHFCLWLAHSSPYLPTGDHAYEMLRAYVLSRIDFVQLRLDHASTIYPALDFPQVPEMKDEVIVTFLEDLLANCKQTRHLVMCRYESIRWTLKALRRILPKIRSIHVSTTNDGLCAMAALEALPTNDWLEITLHGQSNIDVAFEVVLNKVAGRTKNISLTLVMDDMRTRTYEFDLSQFFHKDLKRLRIIDKSSNKIVTKLPIPVSPSMTHLSVLGSTVCDGVLSGLSDSVLPQLQHFSLAFSSVTGNPIIPECQTLVSLDWYTRSHQINFDNISRLPNLETLSISAGHLKSLCQFLEHQSLSKLTRLAVFDLTAEQNKMVVEILQAETLENIKSLTLSGRSASVSSPVMPGNTWNRIELEQLALTRFSNPPLWRLSYAVICTLDISHSRTIRGRLSALFSSSLPSLHTLILSDCAISLQDLCSLMISKVDRKLPELRSLDISYNFGFFAIMNCFEHTRESPCKECLRHSKPGQQFSYIPSKSLNCLQKLTISVDPEEQLVISTHWPYLEKLSIVCQEYVGTAHTTWVIADACEKRLLPRLRTVQLFVEKD